MQVLSQSGSTVTDNMMSAVQSSLAKTGIDFSVKTAPLNSVLVAVRPVHGRRRRLQLAAVVLRYGGQLVLPGLPER